MLQELVTLKKGSTEAEECLYMLAMAEYGLRDYETASEYFKKYYQTYPKGIYAENAKYYVGESLYKNAPEPRLDQSLTVSAIAAFQEYLDLYGGHAVISIGHSHPHYIQKVTEQLNKIGFYSNSVINKLQVELAERLGKMSG